MPRKTLKSKTGKNCKTGKNYKTQKKCKTGKNCKTGKKPRSYKGGYTYSSKSKRSLSKRGGGCGCQAMKGGSSLLGNNSDVVSSFGGVDSLSTSAKLFTVSSNINPAVYSQNIGKTVLV